jgi:succinate dehydrogenase / fumarate reductase flavoprotein subunit
MNNIIIIGAGFAGLSASINCAKNGFNVILISNAPSERAQSVMAEGGINSALNTKGENDSVENHFEDTIKAGLYLADPNAVKSLVGLAPKIVKKLSLLGVAFNRDEKGNIDLRNFGGQKKKRTAFAKSSSGKQIMTALIQEARKYEDMGLIKRYSYHSFIKLIKNNNEECVGCIIMDNESHEIIALDGNKVIIASGGMHGLFKNTTGSLNNNSIVTAELFSSGIPIANGEFIQYHPTTVKFSKKHLLISEAARGEGGRLFAIVNNERWYFMEEKYPELGNLMPRDVVSREIWSIISKEEGLNNVFLDLTEIPEKKLKNNLFDLLEDCKTFFNIDPEKEPIPVMPGIHYFMGGIKVDEHHRTNLKNLYAAGECCCQYHGANRLGGNSILGGIFGGLVASKTAMNDIEECENNTIKNHDLIEKELKKIQNKISSAKLTNKYSSIPLLKIKLNNILEKSLGIIRNKSELEEGICLIDNLINNEVIDHYDPTTDLYENLHFKNQCILGKALLKSALARKESRGAHTRSDFTNTNNEDFKKTTVAEYYGNNINIHFENVPKLR